MAEVNCGPLLTPAWRQILLASRVGHLATADEAGQPYLVPCCFTLIDDRVVTAIDEKPKQVAGARLRRIQNILANPKVALSVDHYEEDWTKIGFVLVLGEAAVIEPGRQQPAALAALRAKYRQYGPMRLEAQPLIEITPTRVTGWGIYRR